MAHPPLHIKNLSKHPLPKYQTVGAAAFDLAANIDAPITLGSLERALIPTGLYIAVPEGYELQIRARSGLAAKHGIGLVNGPGTIDSDYRGEIIVIIVNLSHDPYTIHDGDRVAQGVVAACVQVKFIAVEELDDTPRGHGGFGHTGKN
jgi:dUTP pyrophosphatase